MYVEREWQGMKELQDILDSLYEIEHNQESFEFLLSKVEECYEYAENRETKFVVNSSKVYIRAVRQTLSEVIDKMDGVLTKLK